VRIFGSNLGLVYQVLVDGMEIPILNNTGVKIAAGPLAPRAPGFVPLRIRSLLGDDDAELELLPSLVARRRMGTLLSIRLNAGDTGTYVLRATYEPLVAGVAVGGVHHLSFINPLAGTTSVLQAGVFPDANPVSFTLLRPYYIGLIGAPITLQAACAIGTEGIASFTNRVDVP
jgi:hypothetical protein